ncbi:hypothetical protein EDP2_3896 [Enterobacter cloacae S611]|uniref:Uncharacterized protein n=1 Tax=Enterobacter cloacae S611 TaxID=1399146 RepID=A0ABN0QCU6_ENTCL|nr:hypothetical protein EDP2_3896 [Enterobacter cloacae S611]
MLLGGSNSPRLISGALARVRATAKPVAFTPSRVALLICQNQRAQASSSTEPVTLHTISVTMVPNFIGRLREEAAAGAI